MADQAQTSISATVKQADAISKSQHQHPNSIQQAYVFDDLHPEDNAMLQALYSRSPNSVLKHLDKVKGADSGTFMEKFYVGYGHSSIADCGTTTVFIENVSMLVAKAVQDWPLYSGQEASTRYLDYSQQAIIDPVSTEQSKSIQKAWMDFYNRSLPKVKAHLTEQYPLQPEDNPKVYEKAIAARSFDILRGFLPAGCTTYLSWHTNLRQAQEKLTLLDHHPLEEIKETSKKIRSELDTKYKHSFSHQRTPEQEEYFTKMMEKYAYFDSENHPDFEFSTNIKEADLIPYEDALQSRPAKTSLPVFMGSVGQFTFKFQLDFGSFRDIQRHRNGECKMPLLTTRYGFYPWYLEQLPKDVRAEAEQLIGQLEPQINSITDNKFIRQYYIPMGYAIAVDVTYRLPAALYVAELRSGKTVHPTLRRRAHQMGLAIRETFPNLNIYLDLEESDWDVKRGTQDIVKK